MEVEIVESYYAAQIKLASIKIQRLYFPSLWNKFDEIIDYFYSTQRNSKFKYSSRIPVNNEEK